MTAMVASGVHPEDVLSDKDYIIYKSAISYNPDYKIKFSTWLGNQVRYHCLNKINRDNVYVTMEDGALNYFVEKNRTEDSAIENGSVKEFIFNILSALQDKRIAEVFRIRYYESAPKLTTWRVVAQKMNISSQTAINVHNRGKKFILNQLNGKRLTNFL